MFRKSRYAVPLFGSSFLLSFPALAQDGIRADIDHSEGAWNHSKAFGWFAPLEESWIYHHEHGLMAETPIAPGSSYLWSQGQGWWFVSLSLFPWIYDAESAEWIYYGGKADLRWFYRPGKAHWINEKQHENLKDLRRLLKDLRKQGDVSRDLVEAYQDALKTLIDNIEGPSEEALEVYAELHAAIIEDGEVTAEEHEALRAALDAVLDSIVVAEEDAEAVRQAWLAIIDASKITEEQRAALEALIGSVFEHLRERIPGWGRDGKPERPRVPGLRHAYSMMLALNDALLELMEPNKRPEVVAIRNFVRVYGRALVDEDVTEQEHLAIAGSIETLRRQLSPDPEQDRQLYSMLRRFASARIDDEGTLQEVYASIDLAFGVETPPENVPDAPDA